MARFTSDYGERGPEQIRTQNNRSAQLLQARSGPQNKAPVTMRKGDFATSLHPRGALMTLAGDKNSRITIIIPRDAVNNLGTVFGTGIPTTDDFPEDGQYGWKIDEAAGKGYWSINIDGTVYYMTSTVGGINFTDITGTITDAQHGNLGRQTGGNPHHTNATSGQPGFMSTTHFDMLDLATAAATASRLVLRNASGAANFADTCNFANISLSGNATVTGNLSAANVSGTASVDAPEYSLSSTIFLNSIDTGWTAMTGTATKGGFDTTTVTLPQLAQVVKALSDAFISNAWPQT